MQVILREKVENLGTLGDIVNVKSGYARNYLVPYGKAVHATQQNVADFEKQKSELQKAEANRLAEANLVAEKIKNETFTIKAQAGDGGKLFGSVGTKEVSEILKSSADINVEKRHVRMPQGTIRTLGEFDISIQLHTDVVVQMKLVIEAE